MARTTPETSPRPRTPKHRLPRRTTRKIDERAANRREADQLRRNPTGYDFATVDPFLRALLQFRLVWLAFCRPYALMVVGA